MDLTERQHIVKHIDRKLIIRMRMFIVVFLGTFIYGIVDTVRFGIPVWYFLGAFVVGLLLGVLSGRMQKITFDHDAYKIISRMDRIGVIILVIYIGLAILRRQLIIDRIDGPAAIAVVTIGVVSGTMFGRVFSMRYAIRNILKTIGIVK